MLEIVLINTQKPQETKTVSLTPEKRLNQESLLGRDERCAIVLNDSMTSRIHGKIFFRDDSYYYNDLGSRNGSRLNNQLLEPNQDYQLKSSDTLALGYHLIWLKSIDGVEAAAISNRSLTPKEFMPLATIAPESIHRWSQGEINAVCVQVIEETHDVRTFSFVADPPVLFTYQPGQFVTLELEIDGQQVKSSYFISSTPSRPHILEITVKRVSVSTDEPDTIPKYNNWLHENMRVGGQVKMSEPTGKFTCFANPSPKVMFISAGSGISPIMSMSRWLCDTVSDVDIIFFHSARSPRDIIFRPELELMAARYSKFRLAITITRPEVGQSWVGYTGRMNELMLMAIAPDFAQRKVYVCGSNVFREATKNLLQSMSFPWENYYEASFANEKQQQSIVVYSSSS